jgi:hypothetical protein
VIAEHIEHRERETSQREVALRLADDRQLAHQSTPFESMP